MAKFRGTYSIAGTDQLPGRLVRMSEATAALAAKPIATIKTTVIQLVMFQVI
jgi:hypothetical protein